MNFGEMIREVVSYRVVLDISYGFVVGDGLVPEDAQVMSSPSYGRCENVLSKRHG